MRRYTKDDNTSSIISIVADSLDRIISAVKGENGYDERVIKLTKSHSSYETLFIFILSTNVL